MNLHEAARTFIGVPWKHMGRTERGLDCGGLPELSYLKCGRSFDGLPKRYGRDPFQNGLMTTLVESLGEPVWKGDKGRCHFDLMQPGDIVLMAPAAQPRHLAIIGDDEMYGLSLIHADGSPGVKKVIEHGMSDYYRRMIVAVFRRPV